MLTPLRRRGISRERNGCGAGTSPPRQAAGLLHRCTSSPTYSVAPPSLTPAYSQIWAYRNAKEGSLSYVAEEDLTLQPACGDGYQEEEFEDLTQMHDVGRWFGTWEVPETGVDEFRFVPSAELRALYPDD